ncbi:MAG: hypothetical protein C7B46_19920 [Sulfobacillus benefaciens]|uniref:Uncharacterized protein n=1 Tax=Sulfobacillus benefaciens TaxID=453960 RepID=A0A2T2WWA4_9FIRM|nr:MAG: hypothetical protein C7B46_19920 [Sulfobacillus benefaciens]
MITANEILTALTDEPTERHLGDILAAKNASSAITWLPDPLELPDPLDNLDAIGYALIRTEDGLLCIPYTLVDPDCGWEQLDLSAAFLRFCSPNPAAFARRRSATPKPSTN